MITKEFSNDIEQSVLCWLATSSIENEPNVSPKEIFILCNDTTLLIANIASPISIQNIEQNPQVCVSFLNIFLQKGCKIKGIAKNIKKNDHDFDSKLKVLTDKFTDKFPILSIIEIRIQKVDKIFAPSYHLFPETTEESQIENAMISYKVKKI